MNMHEHIKIKLNPRKIALLVFITTSFTVFGCSSVQNKQKNYSQVQSGESTLITDLSNLGVQCEVCPLPETNQGLTKLKEFLTDFQQNMDPLKMGKVKLYIYEFTQPINNQGFMELPLAEMASNNINPIWIHEFAHNYFRVHLSESLPEYKGYILKRTRLREISYLYDYASEEEQEKLVIENNELVASFTEVEKNLTELIDPYDELFADFVTIFYLKDPKAISKVISINKNIRDFSSELPLNQVYNDKYGVFAPIRKLLWKEHSHRIDSVAIGSISKDLLQVMINDISERIASKSFNISDTNREQLLNQFQDRLESFDTKK